MESEFIKSELISLVERMSRDHTTLAVAWLLMGTVSQIHSESEEQKDELIHREHSLWRGKGRNTCTIASRAGGDKMAVLIIEIGTIKEKIRYNRKGTRRARSHLSKTPGCKFEGLALEKNAA